MVLVRTYLHGIVTIGKVASRHNWEDATSLRVCDSIATSFVFRSRTFEDTGEVSKVKVLEDLQGSCAASHRCGISAAGP
jgi:hypothetical protein